MNLTLVKRRKHFISLLYIYIYLEHFVISLNFPCLTLFTVLFAYGCFVVTDCVEVAVDRIWRIRVTFF